MTRWSSAFVVMVLLVVIQSTLVQSWWSSRRRRRVDKCSYPRPRQGNSAKYSDYFYGDMSLFDTKSKGKRHVVKNTWRLRHSLLLFRGTIFEWGINYTYYMSRFLDDCKIKWRWAREGSSKCLLSDAKTWTRGYRGRYGKYHLLFNNCHHFVNRLAKYLDSNCQR